MRISVKILTTMFLLSIAKFLFSQQTTLKLWKEFNIDNRNRTTIYIKNAPDSINTGVMAIVCPGGSYRHLMGIKTEGFEVADWLNQNGINAVILKYRVGKNGYHHPSMIEDLQATIYYVRENADKLNINPNKVGVIGFSAGGHLSLLSGIFRNTNFLENKQIYPDNLTPNFIVPVYPVVSMQDSIAHKRSQKNLLGRNNKQEQKDVLSIEKNITSDFPPVLLVATEDDPVVNPKNSLILNSIMLEKQVKNYKFLFTKTGGHGFGLNNKLGGEAANWKYKFLDWLKDQKIL